ncbi:hypothetical protein SDRG_14208 [Saprolegnia diclina VS20]|uniref:Uncharacterized protein n=1 Tax=Saprolegnia diclina (strain VS20) TaxID=1156394 RepID=T0RER8_SAPDV|nr:hypothetical protein SDRG_14208 [Saprolegnia diclina VS20]EQC28117.1 hypothetical protein SDRG_14208 [Saprolegnia diclina VS20]|eukprot:XP_008618542.1 hypothetical protein SDRG_14208 [Saprolegnia diclina VS20]
MGHAGQALLEQGRALPSNLSFMAFNWEAEYFWMKSSTNGIILTMALSCFLAIAAIGWSMSGSLRFAIFLVLVIIPSSHALFAVYLANSIEAADYCIAPAHNTLRPFRNDSGVAYLCRVSHGSNGARNCRANADVDCRLDNRRQTRTAPVSAATAMMVACSGVAPAAITAWMTSSIGAGVASLTEPADDDVVDATADAMADATDDLTPASAATC